MRPRIGAALEHFSLFRPSGDGAGGPAFHVKGPHLTIPPRPVPVFDRDAEAFPIGRGNFTLASFIRSHPSSVVLADQDGEDLLFQTQPFVAPRRCRQGKHRGVVGQPYCFWPDFSAAAPEADKPPPTTTCSETADPGRPDQSARRRPCSYSSS